MSTTVLPEGELLELLVQLQKTTPDSARAILNAQPAIGYALVPLMVRMGIVNLEVLQKTLSSYSSQAQVQVQPTPAVPPHVAQQYQHHPTPPPASQTPYPQAATPYAAYPPPPQNGAQQHPAYANPYAQPQSYAGQVPSQYAAQQQQYQQQRPASGAAPAPAPAPGTAMLGALGNIPDDQREMIMRVISMTPEQINRLPPQDRAITLQLRATLGLPIE